MVVLGIIVDLVLNKFEGGGESSRNLSVLSNFVSVGFYDSLSLPNH